MPYLKSRGDYGPRTYRRSYRGDPGLLSFLGKAATTALSIVPGGGAVKTALSVGSKLLGGGKAKAAPQPRTLPPAPRGTEIGMTPYGTPYVKRKKRRRMDYGNIKALRRADRRLDGFVGVARKALKHTNYKVVSRGAGKSRGSRGVITRAEARRALNA